MAIVGALVGLGVLILTVIYGNKFEKKILQYLAAIVGIVVGISVAGIIAEDEASKAGEYMVYLAIPLIIPHESGYHHHFVKLCGVVQHVPHVGVKLINGVKKSIKLNKNAAAELMCMRSR